MSASIWAPADGDLPVTTTKNTASQTFVAGAAQTVFTLTTFTYAINTQSFLVFKNGVLLAPSTYTETSTTSFTLTAPATAGDIIIAYAFTGIIGLGIFWKGAYNAVTTYLPGSVVSYLGASYISILQTTGNLPISVTYWNLLADKGVAGAAGAGTGDMLAVNNLSELTPNKATARANISAASDAGDAGKVFFAANSAGGTQQVVPRSQADSLYSGNGFAARKGGVAQAIPSGVVTLVTFNNEDYDTLGNYASSRFTPTVVGTYLFSSSVVFFDVTAIITVLTVSVYKNGLPSSGMTKTVPTNGALHYNDLSVPSVPLTANGTTDYFEIYVTQNSGISMNLLGSGFDNYFSAVKVI